MRQKSSLREYQNRIATFLYEHDQALCVVRPGGGKTAAALTAIAELIHDKVIRQALVIAPKRVAQSVWPLEIAEWAHTIGLSYALLDGSKEQRNKALDRSIHTDLVIVGIDNVQWLIDQLVECDADDHIFDLLVIDEISKLRNPTGVRSNLLAKHGKRWRMRWGLSGTLRPNSAQDLFMPVRITTQGGVWGKSFYQWRKDHFYPADYHGYEWRPFPDSESRLNEEIAPLVVALRDDEMPQLPKLSVIIDRVELPGPAKAVYSQMHRTLVAQLESGDMVLASTTAVATGKMAQIANGFIYDEDKPAKAIHDEKRDWLQDILESATEPTLLIYEYQHDLAMIRELRPYTLDVSDKDAIARWNAGELSFMTLHPAAGGHGLNLQAGGCDMAWLAPTWSPEHWEQTIARLHRSGQTKPVMVRVCVATGTVDEMKLDRVHGKMKAQQAFERYLALREEGIF